MWLNNYERLKFATVAEAAYALFNGLYTVNMSSNPIRGTNGTYRDFVTIDESYLKSALSRPSNVVSAQTNNNYSNYSYCCNLVVGSGTTPVTLEDYCLESEIVSLSCTAVTGAYDVDNGTVTYEKVMKNTSDEGITVNEIGIVIVAMYSSSAHDTSTTRFPVLVYREVLETPITVGPGETFTVTITHQLPLPQS